MITTCNEKNELPSCKIYEILSKGNNYSGKFDHECERLEDRLGHNGILDLCKKLADNLLNFCSNDEKKNPLNGNCEFLHYWLFYEIINNINLTDNGMLVGVMSQFYYTWKNIMEKSLFRKKYEPNRILFNKISPHDLMFRKDMYDYIYNYDDFDKITFDSTQTDSKYCRYLPSMLAKYEQFKDSCPQRSDKCFHDAKSFEEYNPDKLCKKFQCKDEPLCSKYIEETPEPSDTGRSGLHEVGKEVKPGDIASVSSADESETSTILTTVGPSFLGIFITSFLLYK
ncbi:PIR Superfamily Protein, partial [Plasmodium ovale curtisi]